MKAILKKSKGNKYKYTAIFYLEQSTLPRLEARKKQKKTVHFGAKSYSDFTIHKDIERKKRYLLRHKKKEDWNNPLTAGALSRFLLWNKPTLAASIKDYKKRFGISLKYSE